VAYDENLAGRVRDLISAEVGVTERRADHRLFARRIRWRWPLALLGGIQTDR
jgi:hypothetical protein